MVQYTFWQFQNWGVFDVILPFILIFTIVFAILQKTKILGEKSKNFNTIIALVMGASVVVPHVFWGDRSGSYAPYLSNGMPDVVNIINRALPNISVILVAILMLLLIIGIWGSKVRLGNNNLSGIIALFAFVVVIFIFGAAADWWRMPYWLGVLEDPNTQALIVTVLVFAIIIWFITKEDEREKDKEEAFGKFFGNILDNKDKE